MYEIDLNQDENKSTKTKSQQGRGRCGCNGVMVSRPTGQRDPSGRRARELWGRESRYSQPPSPSLCCHHCSPHTQMHTLARSHTPTPHTHRGPSRPDPESLEEGKTRSLAPGGPALAVVKGVEWRGRGSSQAGKDTCPHAAGPWLRPGREQEGWEARTGLGTRAWWPASRLLPKKREGSYDLETALGYQKGPWGLSRSQAASGLIVYSVTNAFVSFIDFKYKQNKNHIFFRQQQFSR